MEHVDFLALVVAEDKGQHFVRSIQRRTIAELPQGEVLIRVRYSSLNYKDALSATGNRGVTKQYPHTPGIDAAGIVIATTDPNWHVGEEVICTGYDLGMNTSGGFGQYIRVPAAWVVRKPASLSLLDCMQLGTAGLTAALCVLGLVHNGVTPEKGTILVTGATGGVGTIAIMLLHALGFNVAAMTGKTTEAPFLGSLGASQIISRAAFLSDSEKTLLQSRWAGVVDTVGGSILATAVKSTTLDGVVTCCGNAASGELPLNVYPFILRGVHLLGVYSANCPMDKRLHVWGKLAGAWRLPQLSSISRVISLYELEDAIQAMLAGQTKGRYVVDLGDEA